ncbi:DUF2790 domain-containing protein [Pseudomonas sp. HN11]|uniref:DUF2790 domain-containing protein n=1 Tax=Pseudomonas sp. HN11 TaxID=1344094 RepID=UPI001F318331|nr:DUF2790 domain-containing protein [Pseudomonas sp. HN11]UII71864.1 DUF2790 domain-containing protein [Pseudomonas sp. HN11]
MNWNTLIAVSLLAFAVNAHADVKPKPDIQRVLATVEDGGTSCGIVNARMTYLDSHGQKQVLDYKKFADNCAEGS